MIWVLNYPKLSHKYRAIKKKQPSVAFFIKQICVVCLSVLADFNSKKTTTTATARLKQSDVSGNRTDTRKWESCTN